MTSLINALFDPRTIIEILALVGIVIGNIFLGRKSAQSGALADAKATNDLIKSNRDELQFQLNTLKEEMKTEREARIRAETLLIERDKRIKELTDQVNDRDPALKEYLTTSNKTMNDLNALIRASLKQNDAILKTISKTKVVVTHGDQGGQ